MFHRTMDATFANVVANHPEIRPYLGNGNEPLDLGPIAANPENIILEAPDRGVWILQAILPAVYELHTCFLPEARGREYFAIAKSALDYIFTTTDALEIVTKCPDENGGARMAAGIIGFRERFRREGAWETGCGVSYQALTVDDWYTRSKACWLAGRHFHEDIEAAKIDAGVTATPHPEDKAHDRAVGAAYLMIKAGMTDKGIGFFNRWASFAGYATIMSLGHNVIDIRDAVVEVLDGQMRVMLVRRPPE